MSALTDALAETNAALRAARSRPDGHADALDAVDRREDLESLAAIVAADAFASSAVRDAVRDAREAERRGRAQARLDAALEGDAAATRGLAYLLRRARRC